MSKSTTHANAVLDQIFRTTTITSAMYVSLHTADPGTTGASEVSGGSYARVQVNLDGATTPFWDAASAGSNANNGAITFPQDGGGASVSHVGLYDAASGGNFLRGGALTATFTYGSTVTPEFASGALTASET